MKKIILFLFITISFLVARADEGMWLPLFLKYNEAEMQQLGFKLTAEDVYSVNHHSMKDAIVLFGGGCTGELISPEGLLLTNHHCGYSFIQQQSTLEHNYLHNGFWAKTKTEELPNAGLTVTFLIKMEDVTAQILEGTFFNQCDNDRDSIVKVNIAKLTKEAVKGTHYTAVIKPFYYGNQYFMFINETFKDVRLVGSPPESIGKFGGDTDNWMWPRHTGDFSIFRIYTAPDGTPAEYSPNNIPLKSKQFFKISTKGIEKNDFTLVFGYPGTTQQFLISDAVKQISQIQNPVAIHQRGTRLDIMKKYMDESTEIRLMYSAKANSISNGWKKWIGENKGLEETRCIEQKIQEEKEFQKWVNSELERKKKYGDILVDLQSYYQLLQPYTTKNVYLSETFFSIELFRFAEKNVYPLIKLSFQKNIDKTQWQKELNNAIEAAENFYSTYYKPIDKEVFINLSHYYFSTIPAEYIPENLKMFTSAPKSLFEQIANYVYDKSFLSSAENFEKFMRNASPKAITKLIDNELFLFISNFRKQYIQNYEDMSFLKNRINILYRTYIEALMEKEKNKVFYPDANLTMRVTYGQVDGFFPKDGVEYVYYTTLKGVIEKENPEIFDYKVAPKLKELYEMQDYGQYANDKGELPVAFIASNHTTGGNSGSPVLNANGELIGVNFDRVWEGTMSDINYDVKRCRNISLDIRYFLFIVDKFAGAQNLINEMTLVK